MILAGDWAPGECNAVLDLEVPDCLLANLESPVLDYGHNLNPVAKAGPHLWTRCLPRVSGQMIFSLANNHIMDYGVAGLQSTTAQLSRRGYRWVGAGGNSAEAGRATILDCKGVRYGILARCETQFGAATASRPGVAILDPTVGSAIVRLKSEVDMVIVSVHAASEMSPWPSPKCQQVYRAYIDAGADVVHGHHAHVPQGYEFYSGGIIFYGMGNLCVDPSKWLEHSNASWSIVATIEGCNRNLSASINPVSIQYKDSAIIVGHSPDKEAAQHLLYLQKCSQCLTSEDLLMGLWQETAMRTYERYYANWLGFQKPGTPLGVRAQIRQLVKTVMEGRWVESEPKKGNPSQEDLLLWHVLFNCESHRDAISTALGLLGGELDDMRNHETRRFADEMMPWSVGVVPS
jgi:hypothetical protein